MRKSNIYSQIFVVVGLLMLSTFKQQVLKPFENYARSQMEMAKIEFLPTKEICPIRKELLELKRNSSRSEALLVLSEEKRNLRELVEQVALETDIPAELLHAICEVESNFRTKAFKRNDGGRTNHAFGVCQVLRRTGEMVLKTKMNGCKKNYKWTPKSKRTKDACPLFDPHTNITAAALYLKTQMNRYKTLEDLIASYNAGSIRRNKKSGDYINRHYINKVFLALHKQNAENYALTSN